MTISVSATEAAVLTGDTDGDGIADPGETLTFTVTIQNTSNAGEVLTGVQFAQMLSGVTLVPGSINVSPVAFNDSFTAVGNTLLVVGGTNTSGQPASVVAGNLFSNDVEYLGDTFTLSTYDSASANGGQVTVNADGSFTYTSAAGFEGTDTFTYTIADGGGLSSTATVTIAVGGVTGQVWYVDSSYDGSNGVSIGTSLRPFTSLTELNGLTGDGTTNDDVDGDGDYIYVEGAASGGIVLETGQSLIGKGVDLVVGGFTLASAGARSDITGASGFTVTLAGGGNGNNAIGGIDINGVGGITGATFGTLTVNNATIDVSGQALSLNSGAFAGSGFVSTDSDGGVNNVSLTAITGNIALGTGAMSGATAGAFVVSGGSVSTTYAGSVAQFAASQNVISVSGGHAETATPGTGTLTFTGGINGGNGTGLRFDNADGIYNFSGALNLTTGHSGMAIVNGSDGDFTFSNAGNSISRNLGGGDAFVVSASNANITYTGSIGTNAFKAVNIDNHDAGTITFQGGSIFGNGPSAGIVVTNSNGGTINFDTVVQLSSSTGNAIALTNNTGGTMNFSGTGTGVDITTTTGNGFVAAGGGTVTLSGSSNTIATTSGRAVGIDNVTIGGAGVTFQSVGVSNGTSTTGVFLNNAGSGGFTITGTGTTAGSGGTISSIDAGSDGNVEQGIGIYINNTNNISLSNMAFTGDFANFGIRGVGVNNFTLRDSTANSASADNGGFGTSNAADEGVISFDNLTGTALFTGNNLSDGHEDIIVITNTSGTLNLTVNDSAANQAVIGKNGESVGTATGNDGILVDTSGNAVLNMLVTGVVFEGWRGDGIQVVASGTSTQGITISNNTFHNTHADPTSGGGGGVFLGLGAGTGAGPNVTYAITGNSIRGGEGTAIVTSAIGPSGTMSGTILNNTIGDNDSVHDGFGTAGTGGVRGIFVRVEKDGTSGTLNHAVRIDGNTIGDITSDAAIHLLANGDGAAGAGTARLEATITNNAIDEMGANSYGGINAVVGGAGGSDDALMGLNIEGNNVNLTGATFAVTAIIFDDLANNAQFYLPGYGGPFTDAALSTFHDNAEANNFTGHVGDPVLTSPTGTFATGNAFVLPVPIMAAALPFEDWEAAVREAQQQAYENYLASLQAAADPTGNSGPDTGGIAEPTSPAVVDDGVLGQGELALIVGAAIARWQVAGASEEQLAAMRAIDVSVSDLGGLILGASTLGTIVVDDNAAGWSWFVDATPGDDTEYAGSGTQLTALDANGAAGTRIDLLTVIMHELGHQIGLDDSFAADDADGLMFGTINFGVRRLPGAGEADGAVAPTDGGTQYIGTPISIGTLPAGQSLTIQWQATIDAQTNGLIVNPSNSGTVSWTGPIAGNQPTNSVVTVLDTLTLGNLVFLDADADGAFSAGDSGIDGVTLSLFVDAGDDGTPDGVAIATATTAGGGLYSFTGLAPGSYIVQVDSANFGSGGVLEGRTPTVNAGDPDDNVDNDSNGGALSGGVVNSGTITLDYDTETTLDGTLQLDINSTLDLGFLTAPPVVTLADATVDGTEDTNLVFNAANGNAITVSDPDSATLTVTLTVLNGVLTLSQTTGLAFTTGDGTADASMAFSGSAADINAALEGLIYRGSLNYEGTDTLTVEADDGITTASDNVTITLADDGIIHGTPGDDTISGTAGNDYFDVSQGGDDDVSGGDGMDRIYYGAAFTAADSNDGGGGVRDVVILQGNYALTLGATSLVNVEFLSLQSGSITRWGDTAGNSYSYDITMHEANAAPGQQLVINGQSLQVGENFTFDGSAETDGGRFLVYAGRGTDTFTGGAGNDVFYFEEPRFNAADTVDGGAGMDAVVLSMGSGLNSITFGETQFTSIESISVNNRFATDPTQLPSYALTLANGNVALDQVLIINGSSLDATQTLSVDGSAVVDGRLTMYGGDDNDVFVGGAKADLFYGAGGADTSTGGTGADIFQYRAASDSAIGSADQILDFEIGSDLIDLSFIDANSTAGGNQAFAFIGTGAFTNVAGQLRATLDTGVWQIEGDTDGNGIADFLIQVTATTADPITASDFVL